MTELQVQKVDKIISKIISPDEIKPQEERYHVIKFHGKRYEHETNLVTVCINGNRRVMRREELIPVPQEVVEVLDEARYPQFRTPTPEELLEGKKEKISGYIDRFPYEKIFKDIPKDIYIALRKKALDPIAKPITEKEIQDMLDRRKT